MHQDQSSSAADETVVPPAIGVDGFVIEPARGRLLGRDGGEIAVRPKAFALLVALATANDRPLTKAELLDRIWGRINVTEDSLFQAVKDARRALDDAGGRLLRHIPQRGYLLAGSFSSVGSATARDLAAADGRPSLAVLPLRLIVDTQRAYLATGLIEEISIALSRFRWLTVVASTPTARSEDAAGGTDAVPAGVRYLVDGSFMDGGNHLVIRCRLLDMQSGRHVWQESFLYEGANFAALYEVMTAAIAAALEPRLLRAEIDRVLRKGTVDLAAFDCYLRALPGYYSRSPLGNGEAIALLEQALERDPHFALARALLARCVATAIWLGVERDPVEAKSRVLRLAREALAADRSDPQILALCGHLLSVLGGEHEEGSALLDLSLRVNPNGAEAWRLGAWVAVWNSEPEKALARIAEAERLDPLSPLQSDLYSVKAAALFFAGRYAEAVAAARRSLANVPEATSPRRYLVAALACLRDMSAAQRELTELVRLQPNSSIRRTTELNPLRDDAMLGIYLDALHRAGMPD